METRKVLKWEMIWQRQVFTLVTHKVLSYFRSSNSDQRCNKEGEVSSNIAKHVLRL